MESYLYAVVASAICLALADFIIPSGKLKNASKTILSLVFLLSVIYPIAKINFADINKDFEKIYERREVVPDEYTETFFRTKTEEYYENKFIGLLKDEDIICEDIVVTTNNGDIKKVEIYLSNLIISEENANINNTVIRNYVADVISVERELVEVYG